MWMLGREKAVARAATVLPGQGFAYWQQFKIAHYDEIMQHHRHQFNFWNPGIPRDAFIDWSIFDRCIKEIWGNTWVSLVPNTKASALSNLHHPKNTAPVQQGMKGDQFQKPWKPSAGELPGGGEEEATSSLFTWVILGASESLAKWPTLNFSTFSSCPPFFGSFHTCRLLMWEGTGYLLSSLFYPWLLSMPQAVARVSGDAARKESFVEFGGEKAGDSSSQVSNAMNEISLI